MIHPPFLVSRLLVSVVLIRVTLRTEWNHVVDVLDRVAHVMVILVSLIFAFVTALRTEQVVWIWALAVGYIEIHQMSRLLFVAVAMLCTLRPKPLVVFDGDWIVRIPMPYRRTLTAFRGEPIPSTGVNVKLRPVFPLPAVDAVLLSALDAFDIFVKGDTEFGGCCLKRSKTAA